ncbi:hypothetical protein PMAYCL1PPCAC_12813, partial [Pristionchus mayeri]
HVKREQNNGPPVSSETAEIIRIVEAIKSEVRCGICCSTLKDPVVTTCNHLFCRNCYTECLKQLKSLICPMCKQKLSRRSSTEVDIYANVVSHYLQLAKTFTRDLEPLALRPADNFAESQAVVAPGSAPSPLRNFQPDHAFAIPFLPSKRRGKRPPSENAGPSSKRKPLKLEPIGEELEEEPVSPAAKVKRESPPVDYIHVSSVPKEKVKEERKSTEPPEPLRRSSRGKSNDRKSEEPVEQPLRRSSRGKSAANEERKTPPIEANLDNDGPPISLVPYSQSSRGSSVVPATQSQGEEKEVQTERVEKMDASIQSDETNGSLIDEIAAFRASDPSSSSLSDLAVLLTIHPELSNILSENVEEVRLRFLPPVSTPSQRRRLRQSEVLAQCFATPTGYSDDESDGGQFTKGSSAITPGERSTMAVPSSIDRSKSERITVDGGKKEKEWIRRPTRANTEPVKRKGEERREEREGSEEKVKEESSEEGSVQAERGEVDQKEEVVEVEVVKKKEEVEESDEDDEKEETIAATPEPSEKNEEDEVIVIEKPSAEIETVAVDPFAFDDAIPPRASPPITRRNSSTRSIKENGEKKPADEDVSYDSFNESLVFDTVPEKTEPLGEINPSTKQRTPSRRSPRKTPSKKESLEDSFDEECESMEGVILAVCGVTTRETEELVTEFRSIFPAIKFVQHAEKGATHLVLIDSEDRHARASSLQLASAHAAKCTVLCREWMLNCMGKKKLLDMSKFGVVSAVRGEEAAWQRAKEEAPLLAGYTLLLPNNFADSKALPRDRLSTLIVKCGGRVVDRPWKLPKTKTPVEAGAPLHNVHSMRSFILFAPGSADADSAMRFERDTSVAVFTADWLIESLSLYSIIITDTDQYRVALKTPF